jgi:PAS domain S-box-containing protein
MTSMDNVPYILSAASYFDDEKNVKAILLLASPIDDEFLNASLSTTQRGHLVALLTSEEEPRIMTSSNLEELPTGTRLSSLTDRYLITGKEFFDYGASELQIKMISFVSMDEIDMLTSSVITRARQERAVLAFILIMTSVLMMYWITRNIHQITRRITDFSQYTLGMKPQELPKGDQLQILKERFHSLTEEVVKARETIRRQAEEQTRLIVNNAFDAIITTDENGEIITWNPQAENIFDLKREEAVGQSITSTIMLPQYEEADSKRFRNFLGTGEDAILNRQIQVNALHSGGHEFPVELTISPARSGGKYIFIAIIRDITERKKAEQKLKNLNNELEQKNRELEQIIHITSHDLRTPLVNIYGFSRELGSSVDKLISDLTNDRIPKDIREKVSLTLEKDVLDSLKYISKSVSRMNVLLNGLLKLSRLGRVELKIKEVDMNSLMSDVSGIFEFQLKDAGVKLDVSELPPCEGDEDQLNQVFSNLIGNAMKFLDTGQAGIINVTGQQKDGRSVYCVEDNGIGIDSKNKDRIFEMFQQLKPGTSPGEGLGLTIVHKAVERQNGKVWVESEPGKGSRFYVSLPS